MRKKTLRRPLAMLLAFAMCMGMLSLPALAQEQDAELTAPSEASADTSEGASAQPSSDEGVWKIQEWGGNEDIPLQDGWITADEDGNGFTLDYAKIIEDRGKEGLVLYDSSAALYEDSTLEMDITVSGVEGKEDQVNFYSVAVLPRFVDGKNCEGLAIHDKGRLQRAGQDNGNESWEWIREDKGDFLFDETYHLKLVTEGNTMTVFAAKSGEELQELVSFETKTGVGESGYGFRIWRGAKTIRVDNIVRTEISKVEEDQSHLDIDELEIPADEWGVETVSIPMTLTEGDAVVEVKRDETLLDQGSHYQLMDNQIILELKTFNDTGTFDLNVTFQSGAKDTVRIIRQEPADGGTGWLVYKQGETSPTDPQEGWLTKTETGIIIDYGKIVEDAGEGWVLVDGNAPQYENSVLEYDITFTDATQAPWIAVAPVTRAVDGANYEGFAFTQGTSLERTGRLNNSESYSGINNDLGVSFEYDKTYHLKMETVGNQITVYLTQDGEEQRL